MAHYSGRHTLRCRMCWWMTVAYGWICKSPRSMGKRFLAHCLRLARSLSRVSTISGRMMSRWGRVAVGAGADEEASVGGTILKQLGDTETRPMQAAISIGWCLTSPTTAGSAVGAQDTDLGSGPTTAHDAPGLLIIIDIEMTGRGRDEGARIVIAGQRTYMGIGVEEALWESLLWLCLFQRCPGVLVSQIQLLPLNCSEAFTAVPLDSVE